MSSSIYLNLCILVLIALSTTTLKTSSSVVLKLIHPDLVSKSKHNSNATLLQHVQRTEDSSMARYNYLNLRATENSEKEGIQTKLAPITGFSFYTSFLIGEPPVSQIVAVDSGSFLLWVPCHPCIMCGSQPGPIYNPLKSSTYSSIPCDSQYCTSNYTRCDKNKNCTYSAMYGDGATSKGDLGMEELKFSTFDDRRASFSNIVFGCGHNNMGLGMEKGILGLSANPLSLISRLGSKFSYCIGSLSDVEYKHNHLIIGEDAIMEGDSTPVETDSRGLYYLTLEGISVGDKRLDIDQSIFKRKTQHDGVVIDSGTTITYLARSAYYPFAAEVQKLLSGQVQRVFYPPKKNRLCYRGRLSDELIGFPVVTLHFAGEADSFVEDDGMFKQYEEDIFCLAVTSVPDTDLSIIGISTQQHYNIGYDVKNMTLYFQNIDCALLE